MCFSTPPTLRLDRSVSNNNSTPHLPIPRPLPTPQHIILAVCSLQFAVCSLQSSRQACPDAKPQSRARRRQRSQNSYALSRATTRTCFAHAAMTGPSANQDDGDVAGDVDGDVENNVEEEREVGVLSLLSGLEVMVDPSRQRRISSSRTAREAKRARMRKVLTGPLSVWREASRDRAISSLQISG